MQVNRLQLDRLETLDRPRRTMSLNDTPQAAPTLKVLFDQYFEPVYAYLAFRVLPDVEAAMDLSQEVFLAAASQLDSLRHPQAARAWLLGIARNKAAEHFRSRASSRVVDIERAAHVLEALPLSSSIGHIGRERVALVSMALRQLTPRHAELLEDKYIRGLSLRAIASARDDSEKAVESALARARQAFRSAYANLQAGEEARP